MAAVKKRKRPPGLAIQPLTEMLNEMPADHAERSMWEEFHFMKKIVLQTFTPEEFEEIKILSHGLDEARTVSLVKHKSSNLTLLKKIIHKDRDPQVVQQIHSEIEILHRCNHPNVVHFFGAFLSDKNDAVHIVMEYMNGGCLDSMRRRIGRFRQLELGAIMHRVLKGMKALNADHVVHRDIKPSNILINTKGEVKLCDFGVSKIMHDKSTMELKFKTFVGTLMYMSPERVNGEVRHRTLRSDTER